MKGSKRSLLTNPLWFGIMGIALGLISALAAYGLGRALRPPQILRGAMLNPSIPAVDFSLEGLDEQVYSLYEFRGRPVLLAFSCSACPGSSILMNKLVQAKNFANSDGYDVQVIIISLDPEQESPRVIAEYVQNFDPDFLGLSGSLRDTKDIAQSYDIYFESSQQSGETAPIIENTPLIMLIDKQGIWRAVYPLGMAAEDIAVDLKILLEEE